MKIAKLLALSALFAGCSFALSAQEGPNPEDAKTQLEEEAATKGKDSEKSEDTNRQEQDDSKSKENN